MQERIDEKTGRIILAGTDEPDEVRVKNLDSDGDGRADGLTVVGLDLSGKETFSKNYTATEARRLQIQTGAGNDYIEVDRDVAIGLDISSGDGNDHIRSGGGNDRIDGGDGDDRIFGGDGEDRLMGAAGNDELFGGRGNDQLFGGGGDDKLSGGDGDDELFGDQNNDTLDGDAGTDVAYGGHGTDVIRSEVASQ